MPPELTDTTTLEQPTATNETNAPDATVLGGATTDTPAGDADPATQNADAPKADEPVAAPVVPETYELTLPEGMTALDEELLGEATPIFKELGLDNEGASKILPLAQKLMDKAIAAKDTQSAADMDALRATWLTDAKADTEIGGENFKASTAKAARGLTAMGFAEGHGFREILNTSGLGNHPDMIRTFARLGELIGEGGDFVVGDGAAKVVDAKAAMYPNDVKG